MTGRQRRGGQPSPLLERLTNWAYIVALWMATAAAVVAGFAILSFWRDVAPAGSPMAERVADDEQYYYSEIVASTIRAEVFHRDNPPKGSAARKTGNAGAPGTNPYRRDVHTKSHGCVNAKFEVEASVPAQFRFGIFSAKKSPTAIIRFSSGQPDIDPDKTWRSWLIGDVRGMAVKIGGPKLLKYPDPDGSTQDFIATTSPVFFIRTIEQYSQFSAAFSRNDLAAYFLPHWWNPFSGHMRQLWLLAKSLGPVPDSLVQKTYYSGSAYRLGPTDYVKFRLRPCDPNIKAQPEQDKADYLGRELAKQAAAGHACFNFEVQPQVAGKNMPVEDATVEWREKDSPFQKIAKVTIDADLNKTPVASERCENLEFNPWHSVEDFKPVGVMNRLRKVVYQQMADFRRTKNCEPLCRNACSGSDKAYEACLQNCPLLKDPEHEDLSAGCRVPQPSENDGPAPGR